MPIALGEDAYIISDRLQQWYAQYHRKLPWRDIDDAYRIWLSEIIMQQTRVQQGLPYYERYVATFPTVQDLANASEDEVLRLWQGLGYYSRARNLHHAAKQVAHEYNGNFPQSYKGLRELKGIGDYTAAAIASFAFRERVAVVDGNVYRVLSRVFGIETDIGSPAGKKEFASLAQRLIPESNGHIHNQAMMEFGALHCKPSSPLCATCPLADICEAKASNRQGDFPVKGKKIKVKERHLNYILFQHGEEILGKKRGSGDIWQGLYDFYCIEAPQETSLPELAESLAGWAELQGAIWHGQSEIMRHILTHQKLFVSFFSVQIEGLEKFLQLSEKINLEIISFKRWQELPKPILIATYLHSSVRDVNFAPSK